MTHGTNRRALMLTLVVGLVLAACGGGEEAPAAPTPAPAPAPAPAAPAAPESTIEGTLTWYTQMAEANARAIADAFSAKHPNARVEFIRGDTAELSERIRAEASGGINVVDVFDIADGGRAGAFVDEGIAAPYLSPELEGNFDIDAVVGKEGGFTTYGVISTGICYNTDLVQNPPQRWEDIVNPEYDGLIVMQTIAKPGGAVGFFIDSRQIWGDLKWEAFWTKMAERQVAFIDGYINAQQLLIQGEYGLLPNCYLDFIYPDIERGAPVRWVRPDWTFGPTMNLLIAEKAPNRAAAEAFIDFMLSDEGQTIVATVVGQAPMRRGAPDPKGADGLDLEAVPRVLVPSPWLASERSTNMEFYNEFMRTVFDLRP